MKYLWVLLLSIPLLGQEIQKDGQTPTSFTYDEALEMLKARDAQWEGKIEKADSLIASQKVVITDQEKLIEEYAEQAKVDVLIVAAKDKQIEALRTQNEAHEKMVKLVKPKWYENQYLWLVVGFIFGKI
jgi:vacuolar-type H+-ATPase subunit I/STV1